MSSQSLPKLSHNSFLVLPDPNFTDLFGLKLYDGFDTARRFSVYGKVYQCPSTIIKPKKNPLCGRLPNFVLANRQRKLNHHTSEFNNDTTIINGDTVCFSYNQHFSEKWIDKSISENPLILVHTDSVYMVIRQEEIIMYNGYIWVEPIQHTKEEFMNPQNAQLWSAKNSSKLGYGVIRYAGLPNNQYRDEQDKYQDFSQAEVGQQVFFRKTAAAVEWQAHQKMNKLSSIPYLRIQRKDILGYVQS
jgi:hypothetical protein